MSRDAGCLSVDKPILFVEMTILVVEMFILVFSRRNVYLSCRDVYFELGVEILICILVYEAFWKYKTSYDMTHSCE